MSLALDIHKNPITAKLHLWLQHCLPMLLVTFLCTTHEELPPWSLQAKLQCEDRSPLWSAGPRRLLRRAGINIWEVSHLTCAWQCLHLQPVSALMGIFLSFSECWNNVIFMIAYWLIHLQEIQMCSTRFQELYVRSLWSIWGALASETLSSKP